MNKPVSFDTAKLLKEKDYHELCWQSYKTIEIKEDGLSWRKVGELNKPMYCKFSDCNDAYYGICSAPTIADVLMWLYEKHDIWIQTPFSHNDIKPFSWVIVKTVRNISEEDEYVNCWLSGVDNDIIDGYDSPTKAYEAAIEYVLTKLI